MGEPVDAIVNDNSKVEDVDVNVLVELVFVLTGIVTA
jgi:hypothetical protein